MKYFAIAAASLSTLLLAGCVPPVHTRDISKVTSSTFEQVPGEWNYTIDESLEEANRSGFKPTTGVCRLHSYNLVTGDELARATRRMLDDMTGGKQRGATNTITVRLESYTPRFSCVDGGAEGGSCTGTAEVSLSFSVVKDGKRSNFTVTSERSADSVSGWFCEKALDAPAEATRKAIKDVLDRASERLESAARK